MKEVAKNAMPLTQFNNFAKTWHIDKRIAEQIIQVRVDTKGWKENYTFNEFRKLIYEQ